MSQPCAIHYNGVDAKVTTRGELVVGSYDYSNPYYVRTLVDDQAYNVVTAKAGHRFIVTGVLISTSKNIVGTATIVLYEALSAETTVVDTDILTIDMVKEDRIYLNLFNVATSTSTYINIKATDSQVDCTVFGYYVPE